MKCPRDCILRLLVFLAPRCCCLKDSPSVEGEGQGIEKKEGSQVENSGERTLTTTSGTKFKTYFSSRIVNHLAHGDGGCLSSLSSS